MTRARALVVAAVALGLAVLLALFAVDVLHRENSFAAGDARYATSVSETHLWKANEILPFGTARSALGVDDDLRYRRAARLFLLSAPRALLALGLAPARAQAQGALEDAIAGEDDASRKSALINMLGVLAVNTAASALVSAPSAVRESISDFRRAIRVDPANGDAKSNLELLLRVLERQRHQHGQRGSPHPKKRAKAGVAGGGSGY